MTGQLIAVVGPSGVGKDSIIAGIVQARPDVAWVRRDITRPSEAGGEPFDGVSEAEFARRNADGAYCLSWQAHGLSYGIPQSALHEVQAGADRVINLSRSVLVEANQVFPSLIVLNITASPETLAERLAGRGRETPEDIERRLARTVAPFAAELSVHDIANDGPLENAVGAALDLLQPVRA